MRAGCGERVHPHRPSHGLVWNVAGEKEYAFSDGTTLQVRENDLLYLPRHTDYTVRDISPGDCYAINFLTDDDTSFSPFLLRPRNLRPYADIFIALEKAYRTVEQGYLFSCKAGVYTLLHLMGKEREAEYIPRSKQAILRPAMEYIHNFYASEEISIPYLAALCRIQCSYFRQLFAICYGTSPVRYINQLKLARAKALLSQTTCTIEEIADMAGFHNLNYFHRFFKKETGTTPVHYRREALDCAAPPHVS